MKKLIDSEKKFIGDRIRNCRKLLSLSQEQLCTAIGISKGTLMKMEAGHGFTGDYLLQVVYFFGMTLSTFSDRNVELPTETIFREKLEDYYRKNKSEYLKYLNSKPTLTGLLEFRLKDEFFDKPRTVSEVVEFCKEEYDINFTSSIVSQALKNGIKAGWLKRKKTTGRNYAYQIKNKKK